MTEDIRSPSNDLQRVLDAVIDGVIVVSPEGIVDRINDGACRMLETSEDVFVGRPLAELLGAEHPMLALASEVARARRPIVEDDLPLHQRFGSDLVVDVAISPLSDNATHEPGVVVVLRDRTIGNTLREEASQRQQLASYGHIAAGIAHEVKNPLGGIRGAAELLQLRAEDDRSKRTAELIVREVDRITTLVDELMVFARGEKLSFAPLNLHRLLDQVLELIEADPEAANVAFDRIFDPSIPEIEGDADRLTQVFLNLVRNAIQAMGEHGGSLHITTRMAIANRVVGADGRPVPTVEVIFEDDGPGILPEILDRLATPFFTTKATGTGLGLAVSTHWVTRHGGRLRIKSAEAHGARVVVALPLRAIKGRPAADVNASASDRKESRT